MLLQPEGKIYLQELRGFSADTGFNSFSTLNYGQYFDESRMPFGNLKVFNEDILLAGECLKIEVEENTTVLILPIIGGIELKQEGLESKFLVTEQVLIIAAKAGLVYKIYNPYEADTISFLEIHFSSKEACSTSSLTEIISFDLENKNQLLRISTQPDDVFIGQYDGRTNANYQLNKTENGIFAFVIAGAFEVQDRLLHPKDALALWNLAELENGVVEFEALSNDAILLLFEVTLK